MRLKEDRGALGEAMFMGTSKKTKRRGIEDLNPKIIGWLENGHLREALLGEGDYFIQEYTFREHDALLVIQELLQWAKLKNRIPEVSREFELLVLELCDNDLVKAVRILVAYLTEISYSRISLLCDFSKISSKLAQALNCLDAGHFSLDELHMIRAGTQSLAKEMRGFEKLSVLVDKLVINGILPNDKNQKKKALP
jgi:hypothetical protein